MSEDTKTTPTMIDCAETTTTKTAYGKSIEPIDYEYKWKEFPKAEDGGYALLVEAKQEISQEEAIVIRNTAAKNKARQNAYQAAIDKAGHKAPDMKTDEQFRLRNAVKVIMSDGKTTESEARERASQFLGIKWED